MIDATGAEMLMDCSGADAVKFTPLFDVLFSVTDWLAGLKVSPILLGVTT